MEAKTIRVVWSSASSGWKNFNWDGVITANSVVHISASELVFPGKTFNPIGTFRHRGEAPIWVKNVRPHGPNPGDSITGGVEFYLVVEWGKPLTVATDITVLGDPDDVVTV